MIHDLKRVLVVIIVCRNKNQQHKYLAKLNK